MISIIRIIMALNNNRTYRSSMYRSGMYRSSMYRSGMYRSGMYRVYASE